MRGLVRCQSLFAVVAQVHTTGIQRMGVDVSIKLRRVVVIALSATVLAGVGTAAAAVIHHTSPVSGGVVNGCYKTTAASNGSHAVLLENTGHACPSGYTDLTWNKMGPSGVVSMTEYTPDAASPQTGNWGFLGTPPEESFTNSDTAAEVTGTVDEASADGNEIDEDLGICYEPVGGSTVSVVSAVEPEFAAAADSYFAQTVSGDVGDLTAGDYYVGLCAEDQTDVLNGSASVTITMAQTTSGVTYDGPKAGTAKSRASQ
jgi:hypothetical protein